MRFLKEQYLEIGNYLRQNRWWCLYVIFLIAMAVIIFALKLDPNHPHGAYLRSTIPENANQFGYILSGNLKTASLTVARGFIPLGLGAIQALAGTCLWFVAVCKWLFPGMPASVIVAGILPHGIFEIPAILLCLLVSALLSKAVTQFLGRLILRRPALAILKQDILFAGKTFVFLIIPLILVGAFVESFITANLIG